MDGEAHRGPVGGAQVAPRAELAAAAAALALAGRPVDVVSDCRWLVDGVARLAAGALTNVTRDHMDYHRDHADYAAGEGWPQMMNAPTDRDTCSVAVAHIVCAVELSDT
jgi:hypothetical protein